MIPVIRSGKDAISGGVALKDYFLKRARRILPPYYGALTLCALMLTGAVLMKVKSVHEAFDPWSWVAHLLLVHNLDRHTIADISGPFWSVAVEWQIYLLFPFVFLPLWKKNGALATMAIVIVAAIATSFLLPQTRISCPWFAGLFVMGMCASHASFSTSRSSLSKSILWPLASLCFLSGIAVAFLHPEWIPKMNGSIPHEMSWAADLVFGAGAAILLFLCTRSIREGPPSSVTRFLSWKPFCIVGSFSYSLYLVHSPVQSMVFTLLEKSKLRLGVGPLTNDLLTYGIQVIACLFCSYIFYRFFERPFMMAAKKKRPASTTECTAPASP